VKVHGSASAVHTPFTNAHESAGVAHTSLAHLPRSPRRSLTHRPATPVGAALRLEALAGAIEQALTEGRLPDGWQAVSFQREVSAVLGHLGMIVSRASLASSYARESRRVELWLPGPQPMVDTPARDTLCDPLDVAYALRFIELAPAHRRTA
jgi:hypothetical protein